MVMIIVLLAVPGLFSRRLWHRWVIFAADRKGIYVWNMQFQYTYVPWSEVGESSVGYGWTGTERAKGVMLALNVSDDLWKKIDPYSTMRNKVLAIPNVCRNVEKIRVQIEKIRHDAMNLTPQG